MTSADDFVLQLIQDKGLVPPDIIKLGREQLVSEGVPPTDIDSKLIDLIVDKRYCKYEDITYLLSQEFNIPLISLQDIRVDESVLKLLPQDILRKYNVFPISSSGGQLELAISDPMDMDSVDDISHILNMSVDLRLASPEEIKRAIDDHFGVNAYGDVFGEEIAGQNSSAAAGNTLATKSEVSGRKRTTADVLCGVMARSMVGDFLKQIATRMATKMDTGQSVSLRFTIDPSSAINMDTEINNIMPLSDILISWVKRHAVNGRYHTQGRTSTMLSFSDIYVDNSVENGMQSDINDFALALYQYLKGLNISVSRNVTGNAVEVIIY